MKQKPMVRVYSDAKSVAWIQLKFVIEEAMTSQKRDDVIAFLTQYVIFSGKKVTAPTSRDMPVRLCCSTRITEVANLLKQLFHWHLLDKS